MPDLSQIKTIYFLEMMFISENFSVKLGKWSSKNSWRTNKEKRKCNKRFKDRNIGSIIRPK